ncbi:MAG: YciI family protein [Roseiarcus sp.]
MMATHRLFVVIRRYGPPYASGLPLEEQQDWEAHRAFMNALEAEGLVRLGGPLEEREDVLLIFRAKDKAEIERRLAEDPWTKSGILSTARISRWNLRIGEVA